MKCKECQTENIEGALFCEECGAKLEEKVAFIESAEEGGAELVLTSPDGNRLEIPPKRRGHYRQGRPHQRYIPDVDLTELGGMDKGVSRRHAVIHRLGLDYTVEDMGSTNGTYVNKKKICPMPRRRLSRETSSGSESCRSRCRWHNE